MGIDNWFVLKTRLKRAVKKVRFLLEISTREPTCLLLISIANLNYKQDFKAALSIHSLMSIIKAHPTQIEHLLNVQVRANLQVPELPENLYKQLVTEHDTVPTMF